MTTMHIMCMSVISISITMYRLVYVLDDVC